MKFVKLVKSASVTENQLLERAKQYENSLKEEGYTDMKVTPYFAYGQYGFYFDWTRTDGHSGQEYTGLDNKANTLKNLETSFYKLLARKNWFLDRK